MKIKKENHLCKLFSNENNVLSEKLEADNLCSNLEEKTDTYNENFSEIMTQNGPLQNFENENLVQKEDNDEEENKVKDLDSKIKLSSNNINIVQNKGNEKEDTEDITIQVPSLINQKQESNLNESIMSQSQVWDSSKNEKNKVMVMQLSENTTEGK